MWNSAAAMLSVLAWDTTRKVTGVENMFDFRRERPADLDYADTYYVSDEFRKVRME